MSFHATLRSLEDIHGTLMHTLHFDPDTQSAPRGKPIKELIAASFTLTDPRNRIITSPARNANYGFAVGELCWYLRGDRDLETMQYYNKRMAQFSDDGQTINSAYGNRMFRERTVLGSRSQADLVIEELIRDPDSRRAVMHINEPSDLWRAVDKGSKDVPCTMSLQLFIRDRRLHMHVLMRSNDVVWGMPYDVFSFTCIQEAILYQLQDRGAPVDDLGEYHHTAGSLHLYETHFGMAEEVSKEKTPDTPPMKPFTLDTLENLAFDIEPDIREDRWADLFGHAPVDHTKDSIDWMYAQLVAHKNKRIAESLKEKNEQQT